MEKEKIVKKALVEKRPPLYVYEAKWGEKRVFLHEIIPYMATTGKETITRFIKMVKDFAKRTDDITKIINIEKKGIRILVLEEFKLGKTLRDIIKDKKPLSSSDVITLTRSITKSMQKFHSKSIYGLGIEPENVIVKDAKNVLIRHAVFPLIEKFFKKKEKPEILNPLYLSPEQKDENIINEKNDLFNIGIILFELLNKKYPFVGSSYKMSGFIKGIPYSLQYITERLLNINPQERFDSFNDFLEELEVCEQAIKEQKLEYKSLIRKPKRKAKIEEKPKQKSKEKKITVKPRKTSEKKSVHRKPTISKKIVLTCAILMLVFVALIICLPRFIRMIHPFRVESLSIDKNLVEAKDNNGKILWRFETGSDVTFSETKDIDNDGRNEVVIGTGFLLTNEKGAETQGKDNGRVYILNENGRVIFTKELGRATIYPDGSSLWRIYDIRFLSTNRDSYTILAVLALADNNMDCILFTQTEKKTQSTFWHTGKIDILLLSASPNGEEKLICGGVNMRMGEKPVLFSLSTEKFNDQSPPWSGEMKNRILGMQWYRPLPGGGNIKSIEEKESSNLLVETEMGIKKYYTQEGFEILPEDTSEILIQERGAKYLECFKYLEKAMRFKKEDQNDSALGKLNSAIALTIEDAPINALLYYEKGIIFSKRNQWKSASISFGNASEADSLFYRAFYRLGEVYSEREKFNDAATAYSKARKLSGEDNYLYKMVDCYTALGYYKKAEDLLHRYEKNVKNKIAFLSTLVNINRERGDFKTAAQLQVKIIEEGPKNLPQYILLADIYADMNDNIHYADSLFSYACLQDSTLSYENIETSAWTLYRESKFDEAFQAITAALERENRYSKTSVAARRKLPRLYYRQAIIAKTLGKKKTKEAAIKMALLSQFCKGYIKKQLKYLIESPK